MTLNSIVVVTICHILEKDIIMSDIFDCSSLLEPIFIFYGNFSENAFVFCTAPFSFARHFYGVKMRRNVHVKKKILIPWCMYFIFLLFRIAEIPYKFLTVRFLCSFIF